MSIEYTRSYRIQKQLGNGFVVLPDRAEEDPGYCIYQRVPAKLWFLKYTGLRLIARFGFNGKIACINEETAQILQEKLPNEHFYV